MKTGFASGWLVPESNCSKISQQLRREVDSNADLFLPDNIVEVVKNFTSHEELSRPWNDYLELIHGRIHFAVGGHMRNLLCSSVDPVFFMHHGFIDYIFQMWLDNMKRLGKVIEFANTNKLPAGFKDIMNGIKVFNSGESQNVIFL